MSICLSFKYISELDQWLKKSLDWCRSVLGFGNNMPTSWWQTSPYDGSLFQLVRPWNLNLNHTLLCVCNTHLKHLKIQWELEASGPKPKGGQHNILYRTNLRRGFRFGAEIWIFEFLSLALADSFKHCLTESEGCENRLWERNCWKTQCEPKCLLMAGPCCQC